MKPESKDHPKGSFNQMSGHSKDIDGETRKNSKLRDDGKDSGKTDKIYEKGDHEIPLKAGK